MVALDDQIRGEYALLLHAFHEKKRISKDEFREQRKNLENRLSDDDWELLSEELEVDGRAAFLSKWLVKFEPLDAQQAIGDEHFSVELRYSEAAKSSCDGGRVLDGKIGVVGGQEKLHLRAASSTLLGLLAERRRSDLMHPSVTLCKVSHSHPNVKLHNAIEEREDTDVLAVFVDAPVAKHVVLGCLVGKVSTGTEWENAKTAQPNDIREHTSVYDLKGSLKEYGGWIDLDTSTDGYLQAIAEDVLVLDAFKVRNELSYVADVRDQPFREASVDVGACVRKANVRLVELRVDGMPRFALITTSAIAQYSEVIIDSGKANCAQNKRELNKAKHICSLNKQINKLLDKTEELQSDANPLILQHRESREACVKARAMAVDAYDAWERACEKDNADLGRLINLHQPGTLPHSLIHQLRVKLYEIDSAHNYLVQPEQLLAAEEVVVDDEADDDEEESDGEDGQEPKDYSLLANQLFSDLQSKIFELDSFRPLRPRGDDSNDGGNSNDAYVENESCSDFVMFKEKFGDEVAKVVTDAWLEKQKYADMSNSKRLPWDSVKKEPMTLHDIVLNLAVATMKHAGLNRPPRAGKRRHAAGGADDDDHDDDDDDEEEDDDEEDDDDEDDDEEEDDDDGDGGKIADFDQAMSKAWEDFGEVQDVKKLDEPSKGGAKGDKKRKRR